jgi:hypothetical protein
MFWSKKLRLFDREYSNIRSRSLGCYYLTNNDYSENLKRRLQELQLPQSRDLVPACTASYSPVKARNKALLSSLRNHDYSDNVVTT